jgi:hypothetical protein
VIVDHGREVRNHGQPGARDGDGCFQEDRYSMIRLIFTLSALAVVQAVKVTGILIGPPAPGGPALQPVVRSHEVLMRG